MDCTQLLLFKQINIKHILDILCYFRARIQFTYNIIYLIKRFYTTKQNKRTSEILNLFFIISLVNISLTFTTFLVFSGKKFYSHNVSHSPLRCINGHKYYQSLHAMRNKDKQQPNEPLGLNEDLTFYVWPHLMIMLCMT